MYNGLCSGLTQCKSYDGTNIVGILIPILNSYDLMLGQDVGGDTV